MKKSEELARRWMTGTRESRKGHVTPAWSHPQDVVQALRDLRGSFPLPTEGLALGLFGAQHFESLLDIAWMHDLIEDGLIELRRVTYADLASEVGVVLADCVERLSCKTDEPKEEYLSRLITTLGTGEATVKCADRLCNLRDGALTFKEKRWARYVEETNRYILPLTRLVPTPYRDKLRTDITAALASRPVEGVV